MRYGSHLGLLFVSILLMGGCATVTRGTKEVLLINSDPTGANVTTTTGLSGKTPASFKVSRKGGFTVTVQKESYEPVTVQVSSEVAGAGAAGMAGNVILGGLLGMAIDAGSGAMLKLKPNPIDVKLVPIASSLPEGTPQTTGKPESTDLNAPSSGTAPTEKKPDVPPVEEKKPDAPPVQEKKADAPPVQEKKVDAPPVQEKKVDAPPVQEKKPDASSYRSFLEH